MIRKTLCIITYMAVCGALYGKLLDERIEKLPVDVQRHIESIQAAVVSNDWPKAQKEYDQINWRDVKKPTKILNALSGELKGKKDVEYLRREIKTKYELLREEGDADLSDKIDATPIPMVRIAVQRFPAVEFGQLELVVIDLQSLEYTEQINLNQYVNAVVIVRCRDEIFMTLMDLWEKRYGKQLDFYDEIGNRIVPMPGTVLWAERKAMITAIEAGGDYNALWAAYNEHFQKAVGRRINLKRKR